MSDTLVFKICTYCEQYKSHADFYKNKRTKDGFKCWCKTCYHIKSLEYKSIEYKNKKEEKNIEACKGFKFCFKCKQKKLFNLFGNNKINKDGLTPWCKECCSLAKTKYKKNIIKSNFKICPECQIEKEKNLFAKGKSLCKICYNKKRKFEYNSSEKIRNRRKLHVKKYVNENKNKISIKRKMHYRENKEILLLKNKINREKNKEKYKLKVDKEKRKLNEKKYIKKRELIDPVYKLKRRISRSICNYFRRNLHKKNNVSSCKYLNFTFEQLKQHLESQFESWMNWNNWGIYNPKTWVDNDFSTWCWNIDHIIPQSKLPYSSMEDENFKKCWALENLRPYSAKLNVTEGNRR